MEDKIKRSEIIVKKYRDDWIDNEGKLHTKFIKEIITGPITSGQAVQPINLVSTHQILPKKGFFPKQIQMPFPQDLEQCGLKFLRTMDFNSLITMGKRFLEDKGVDIEKCCDELFNKQPLTNEKEVKEKCVMKKKQNQKKTKKKKK